MHLKSPENKWFHYQKDHELLLLLNKGRRKTIKRIEDLARPNGKEEFGLDLKPCNRALMASIIASHGEEKLKNGLAICYNLARRPQAMIELK